MAADKRAATIADEDEEFDSAQAIRLGAWGVAAAVAVIALVFAGRSELGTKRARAAYVAITSSPNDPAPVVVGQLLARTAEVERETRRLIDTVRSLSSERDRLTMRLGMVERDMGDLTGSISRQASQSKSPEIKPNGPTATSSPNTAPPAISAPPVILAPATVEAKSVRTVAAPPLAALNEAPAATNAEASATPAATATLPETVPLPAPRPSEPMMHAKAGAQQMASAAAGTEATAPVAVQPTTPAAEPAHNDVKPETEETQPAVEIGIDLGPALTMTRLRARWTAFRSAHGTLADGLRPVVSIREVGQSKPVEMRLVVGPVANVRAAAAICAALSGSQFMCQPAIFDGQRLALK